MLNVIDPKLLANLEVEVSVKELKELKERLRKLSQENRAPTQEDWQKLCELTKNW